MNLEWVTRTKLGRNQAFKAPTVSVRGRGEYDFCWLREIIFLRSKNLENQIWKRKHRCYWHPTVRMCLCFVCHFKVIRKLHLFFEDLKFSFQKHPATPIHHGLDDWEPVPHRHIYEWKVKCPYMKSDSWNSNHVASKKFLRILHGQQWHLLLIFSLLEALGCPPLVRMKNPISGDNCCSHLFITHCKFLWSEQWNDMSNLKEWRVQVRSLYHVGLSCKNHNGKYISIWIFQLHV